MPHLSPFACALLGGAALLSTASFAAAQVRIALCGAAQTLDTACQWVDVQTRLTATAQFAAVDIINVTTSGGGGVVVAVFANSITSTTMNSAGRWQTGYEVILDQSGTTTGASSLGTVLQPGHPVMAGVTTFTSGSTGGRPTGTALEVGSVPVALWADGRILVAQGANPQRIGT